MRDTDATTGDAGMTSTAVLDDTADVEAGLDALETPGDARPTRRRWARSLFAPLVASATLLVIWQFVFLLEIKPPELIPSPGSVASSFIAGWQSGAIPDAVWASTSRGLLGFVVAIIIAIPIGFAIALSSWVRAAASPLLAALQTLPSVAWVPAAVLVFGAGDAAIYTVVLLGGVPSIAMGLVSGLDQTPTMYRRVGRVLGARRLSLGWFILLPAAAPSFLGGLRQGWAFAWRSLMAAELIAGATTGTGLGLLLQEGRQNDDMTAILAAVFAILLVGLAIELLVFAPIERRLLHSRGLAGAAR